MGADLPKDRFVYDSIELDHIIGCVHSPINCIALVIIAT